MGLGATARRAAICPWRDYQDGADRCCGRRIAIGATRSVSKKLKQAGPGPGVNYFFLISLFRTPYYAHPARAAEAKSGRRFARGEHEILRSVRIAGPGGDGSGVVARRWRDLRASGLGFASGVGRSARAVRAAFRACQARADCVGWRVGARGRRGGLGFLHAACDDGVCGRVRRRHGADDECFFAPRRAVADGGASCLTFAGFSAYAGAIGAAAGNAPLEICKSRTAYNGLACLFIREEWRMKISLLALILFVLAMPGAAVRGMAQEAAKDSPSAVAAKQIIQELVAGQFEKVE